MKKTIKYMAMALAGVMSLATAMTTTSCNDNFGYPPMVVPGSDVDIQANTTIAELKAKYWSNDKNYVATVGTVSATDTTHVIIAGRVASESASGNIYNNIIIQDETGALTIAVRTKDLSTTPLFGQLIYLDMTGLKIGGYNSLMQVGAEGTYNGAPSMTFMEAKPFEAAATIAGLPRPQDVDTLLTTCGDLAQAKKTAAGLQKWQSQLIRIDSLTFEEPGKPFAENANTNRYAKGPDGQRINIRTSQYATFKNEKVPSGRGSVVGILSYYGTDWQLMLNDSTGIIGFDGQAAPDQPVNPGQPGEGGNGTEAAPYTVAQIAAGVSATDAVWAQGFIVGWIDGKTLADGAKFSVPATVASNILLADAPDVKDVSKCIPVQLPTGDVRAAINLVDNPGNLGKKLAIKAKPVAYFGTNGLKEATDFKLEGGGSSGGGQPAGPTEAVTSIDQNFDAGTSIPTGWSQIQVSGDKKWYIATYNGNNYAAMTGYKGTTPPFDQYLLTPPIDMSKATVKNLVFDTQVNGYGSTTTKFEVYVLTDADLAKATKTKLAPALATAPASGYSQWVNSGNIDLSKYTGVIYIAFRYDATTDANYATWCVDNVKVNVK